MRVVLLQLSDIHFGSSHDDVAKRAIKIKEAVMGKFPTADACFIAVSGDIANTGAPDEYSIATSFLNDLRSAFLLGGVSRVEFVVIPGNHDCNLRKQNDTRIFLLESLETYLKKPVDLDGANFRALIEVQDDFFKFEGELCGHDVLPISDRLHYQRLFTIEGKQVVFHCFNTAWLSRRNEVQSELFIPPQVLVGSTESDAILSVAMFHHPYNWIDSENYRALKAYVEHQADIVFTGHEHVGGQSRRQELTGEQLDYFEAAPLYDPDTQISGFQVAFFDLSEKRQSSSQFQWRSTLYTEVATREWSITRNPARPTDDFVNTPEFLSELRSVGTGFRHPRRTPPRSELFLRDLYIYPDLRRRDLDKIISGANIPGSITGETVPEYIFENER